MQKMVKVRIEQTGSEQCVPLAYYEKYARDGLIFLYEVDSKTGERPAKEELSYKELQAVCAEKGLEFKGNAPKAELLALLEEI